LGDMAIQQLPDGKTLVTASLEGSKKARFGARWVIRRWRWGKEEPLGEVEIELDLVRRDPSGERDLVRPPGDAALSGDGKYLVSCGYDASVVIWDAEKGKRLHDLGQIVRAGFPVTFTPDGKQMVLLTDRYGIRVYDLATGKLSRTVVEDDDS